MMTGDERPPSRPDENQGPWPHHSLTDESGAHGPDPSPAEAETGDHVEMRLV